MLPVLLRLGPITIYSLGFFLCLGFFLACFVVWKQARINGMSEEKVLDVLFLTVFVSLIAGRLGYIFSNWAQFSTDISRLILFVKYPGISYPTMLVTALILSAVAAKSYGLEMVWIWDVFGFAGAFMTLFGNVGCFLDGCFALNLMTPLYLAILSLMLVLFLVFLMRMFANKAELAELSKKRGIFFLCYLIFQLVSLLMTTWYTKNWWREGIYLGLLVVILVISILRYRLLLSYVYRSISQRRSHAN